MSLVVQCWSNILNLLVPLVLVPVCCLLMWVFVLLHHFVGKNPGSVLENTSCMYTWRPQSSDTQFSHAWTRSHMKHAQVTRSIMHERMHIHWGPSPFREEGGQTWMGISQGYRGGMVILGQRLNVWLHWDYTGKIHKESLEIYMCLCIWGWPASEFLDLYCLRPHLQTTSSPVTPHHYSRMHITLQYH